MDASDKAKFKVGDRVRFTDECPGSWWFGPHTKNKEGVIDGQGSIFGYKRSVRVGDRYGYVDDKHIEPATLTIEPGKFYKTRDGRKVGPARSYKSSVYPMCPWEVGGILYQNDGAFADLDGLSRHDLISEWADEPTDTTGYTVPLCAYEESEAVGVSLRIGDGSSWAQIAGNHPAIVCLIENGQPKPSDRPHVHRNKTAASKEAERLAKKYPGQRFGVYEFVSHAEVEKPTYKHEWQRLAAEGNLFGAANNLTKLSGIDYDTAYKTATAIYRAA